MAENSQELLHDYSPMFKVYRDGRVHRMILTDIVPPSTDPITAVQSRDVVIDPETGVSARLFLPGTAVPGKKLPLLVYFHGGGFAIASAFSPEYHKHLNLLVSKANAVAISVDYRLAPEHPLPAAFDDSWTSLKWAASGQDEWIRDFADLSRVYLGGDSAGGNIAHNVALRIAVENLGGLNLIGIFLDCPFFGGEEPVGEEVSGAGAVGKSYVDRLWAFIRPGLPGLDEPWINPAKDENLAKLPCRKVLVYMAELDFLKARGWFYAETLEKSGWKGKVECVEVAKEGHVFSVFAPDSENAIVMQEKIAAFINEE